MSMKINNIKQIPLFLYVGNKVGKEPKNPLRIEYENWIRYNELHCSSVDNVFGILLISKLDKRL